ncbi:hypothetical protein BASA60_000160 [Batrachochytrium salamandrivorans]|nr:hypothetical protein BASA60_000160 [Batrachochytrium salamandrivorans]KAH9267795.1 hypothetical protein BASA83_009734 [Batrachochytrium salamandrivorans]
MRFTVAALIVSLATVFSVTAQPAPGLNPGAQLEKGEPSSNTLYNGDRADESVLEPEVPAAESSPARSNPTQRAFSKEANAAKFKVWSTANVKHKQTLKRLLEMIPDITTASDHEDQLRKMESSRKIARILKQKYERIDVYSKRLKNSPTRLVHKDNPEYQLEMSIAQSRRYAMQAIIQARNKIRKNTKVIEMGKAKVTPSSDIHDNEETRQHTTDSRLEEARLKEARREKIRLEEEARLEIIRLEEARLEVIRLEEARINAARLETAKIEEAKIERARAEVIKQRQSNPNKDQLEQMFGIYSTQSSDTISERRVVAIGDLHSDFDMSVITLQMANIIDVNFNWIAGNTIVVQTGDVTDRGDDTIALYALLRNLADQAKEHGGRLIQLLGNHEIMNMAGDLRYVSDKDIASYGGPYFRSHAFSENGGLGRYLRTLGIAAKVDDTVFFHAGTDLNWSSLGIDVLNTLAHQELVGRDAEYISNSKLFGDHGPLWYRGFAKRDDDAFCDFVKDVLFNLKASRMVIGHTPTKDGMIGNRCDGLVYIIDVGISRAIRGRIAALEIVGDRVTPLYLQSTM